ncbi:MAG: hypothetical protein HDS80_06805 [Bacteroidales bacterium]|nr:hypothetical protein [Bacteroidales bacterium]MBD5209632.1 hypothetical protein [Bacteroidales bacterium]
MTENKTSIELEPMLKLATEAARNGSCDIGLVANYGDTDETRFLLTPEACGLIISDGLNLCMEAGAGVDISFNDSAYKEYGVLIGTREEALRCPVVLSFAPLRAADIRKMNEGATLLCMMDITLFDPTVINALLERHITLGCLDNMYSHNDEPVFANIIDEIDGRAAIMYAQENLSYLGGGKGVLLSGVAGINPCEVLIIGEGTDASAAAAAAYNAGAIVTVMDNDVSALQAVRQTCGHHIQTILIHPRVLFNKIKTADVILLGTTTRPFEIPANLKGAIKDTAFVLNIRESHPSVSVPRTVAMAISNVLVNFFNEMRLKEDMYGMISTTEGVQSGIVTFGGKLVDKLVGSYLSMPSVDISVMLAGKN